MFIFTIPNDYFKIENDLCWSFFLFLWDYLTISFLFAVLFSSIFFCFQYRLCSRASVRAKFTK